MDNSFEQIYRESSRYMAALAPGTRDLSYQDPGETLLELYALLTDIQRFYLEAAGEEHYRQYLRLFGWKPGRGEPEKCMIDLKECGAGAAVPSGYPVRRGGMVFETSGYHTLSRNQLVRMEQQKDAVLLYFREDIATRDPGPVWVEVEENIGLTMGTGQLTAAGFTGSGEDVQHLAWEQMEVSHDGTDCLRHSGFIRFSLKGGAGRPQDGVYRVRLGMEDPYRVSVSRIKKIAINMAEAIQTETFCFYREVPVHSEQPVVFYDYLAEDSEIQIYERIENCGGSPEYRELPAQSFRLENGAEEGSTIFRFTGRKKERWLLFVFYLKNNKKMWADMTGLPNERLELEITALDQESVEILVSCETEKGLVWKRWQRVEDFHLSQPLDDHFTVTDGAICFGDRIHGRIPPKGKMRIIHCKSSVTGVRNRPTAQERLQDMNGDLNVIYKAVTLEDYRELVENMPGNPVSRAVALNGRDSPNQIRIIASPRSERPLAVLNQQYRQMIRTYLEPMRLITTEIVIEPAIYCGLRLSLSLVCETDAADVEQRVRKSLMAVFPSATLEPQIKRPFGETIRYSRVYELVAGIPGVKRVEDLLMTCGNGGVKTAEGDLILPAEGLCYLEKITCTRAGGGYVERA